ncbi:C6 transcription factor (NirA), putative [Cordyceps militaris CM01]|uniref:C6 transcription factor (NirA), putative n=1 Tax=Cordyceps militaris (strain CM01) TaxID=983644 RepID=G3JPK8_CORMM|nr:C6 transcription factor (NirA), putative [Cordyceps militaris CM01]EGX89057.1 C6 transcription factor (NirA), putative [Cordyceps militaris CM01]
MDNDSSASTPSGPSKPSTGSTPQGRSDSASAATPQPPSSSSRPTAGTSSAAHSSQNSKRRRGLGIVTPNACTECRKKRAKCDGSRPCTRCRAQKVECVYEVPIRQSKENLRGEIEQLRHRQRSSDQVFSALVRSNLWEDVLGRLRNGQSVDSISDWLGSSLTSDADPTGAQGSAFPQHQAGEASMPTDDKPRGSIISVADYGQGANNMASMSLSPSQQHAPFHSDPRQSAPWQFSPHDPAGAAASTRSNSLADARSMASELHGPPQTRVGYWAENMEIEPTDESQLPRFRGLEQVLSPLSDPEMQRNSSGTWSNITSDVNLVHHLLALYFCWEYPTFASLSKEHFLRDFQDGRHRYCSPILVNALLALGCRFSTQPKTREFPNDPYSSGDHFFKEALRLLNAEPDHHSLTVIQALGIMSIREASCGRDSESWYYSGQSIRLAIEMGLHLLQEHGDIDEMAVQSATFWGAFALDHAWSLATGSLPQSSCFARLPMKPGIIADIESSLWVPYTDNGAPLQRSCEQMSNVRSVYKCFCELSELVHQSLYMLHSPGKPLTARELLNIYHQYLNWYDRIPETLRLGHNFTPAVLFAHMYYHFAILLLFRPLIKLRIIGSKVSPRDVCSQAADAIQNLLKSYSQLYTLRRTPSFVPYFVLTSTIMHLAIGATKLSSDSSGSVPTDTDAMGKSAKMNPRVSDSLAQGIADLAEMAPCHHFAEQALNILRYLANKWNIKVEFGGNNKAGTEDYEKLLKPYTSSLNFFAPNFTAEDFICRWGTAGLVAEPNPNSPSPSQGTGLQAAVENIENPLFWPFPMQGRPMLPTGKDLEHAGFAMILKDDHEQ